MKRRIRGRSTARRVAAAERLAKLATLMGGFTADTAAKTGKPERSIQRDATRAKALGCRRAMVRVTQLWDGEVACERFRVNLR